jgi:hypothetical protein
MPIYEYHYLDNNGNITGEIIEIYHKISEGPLKYCPKTNKPIVRAFITPPMGIVDLNKPKTIGDLADQNTKKMIKNGDKRIKRKTNNPWWRNKNKPINIRGWDKRKIKKYIETGKT